MNRILLALLFVVASAAASATHVNGGELRYQCLGGDTFEFITHVYTECGGLPNNSITLRFRDGCVGGMNVTVPLTTSWQATDFCAYTNTACIGGPNPGIVINEYRYTTYLAPNDDWVIYTQICCRWSTIANISNPLSTGQTLLTTLDNLNAPCNSSPSFVKEPVFWACCGQLFTYDQSCTEPDGDSVVYTLIAPLDDNAGCPTWPPISYVVGFDSVNFMPSAVPINLNSSTGYLTLQPTNCPPFQRYQMAIRVEEYRNGMLVGSTMRDVTVTPVDSTLALNTISADASCFGACDGMAIAQDTGTAPFTYLWNTGDTTDTISGLCSGSYTVTIVDALNDTMIGYALITQPPALGLNPVSQTNTSCNAVCDGGLVVTAAGGVPPYAFVPSDTLANLCAGTHTVILTDSVGCTDSLIATITEPGPLILQPFANPSNCSQCNGNITVIPNGGTSPYTYQWSSGGTQQLEDSLCAGNYTVTVSDAMGCSIVDSISVTSSSTLTASIGFPTDATCFGDCDGSGQATASGGTSPYSYLWSNGDTTIGAFGLCSGNYSVTVTDAFGCMFAAMFTVSEPAPLTGTVSSTPNSVNCNGTATVNVSGGIGPYVYQWDTAALGQTNATATGLCSGTYCVTVGDANICVWDTCVSIATGLETINRHQGINIYPNPTTGNLTISGLQGPATATVLDVMGRVVTPPSAKGGHLPLSRGGDVSALSIDLGGQPAGVYFLRIETGEGVVTRKVVRQ